MRFYTAAAILVMLSVLLTVAQSQEHIRSKRRMYAMCPPKFQRIGAECYAISDQPANWLEAHFQCKDKNSKLAEPNKNSDRKLRNFFQQMDHNADEIWIGATYDWHSFAWQWSISGKNLSYDAFSRLDPESRQNLEYHCAVFNPSLKYRWSARPCVDKHRYICQHKMPKVSEKNRIKVYDRWNQTYPNQLANEVILEVIDTKPRDGVRTHRRVKPIDSGENYPMRTSRRPNQLQAKPRRRPRLQNTNNEINVRFIPNYRTNEINGEDIPNPLLSTVFPLPMDFVPANLGTGPADIQAVQGYPDTTTTRTRKTTKAPSTDNETVEQKKPKSQGKRIRTSFDKLAEQKRRQERERKRAEHRRRKLLREKRLRAKQEEDKKKQQQAELDVLKQKLAEEDKQLKEQELANLVQREKLEAKRVSDQKERQREEEESKRLQEQREEEEERQRKHRLHEENRLRMEQEAEFKEQQNERERQLEEQKRVAEQNRLKGEEENKKRQEELKRLQEEDEKRLEIERIQIERKREEEEIARLEEENRKRIAAQKAREEEIRRREQELERQKAEEQRLQEELKIREEQDRQLREQEQQREIEEKKQKEETEKREQEYQDQIRRQKEEKLKRKIEIEAKQLNEEKREKLRKYAERISRLSPEAQKIFMDARRKRKKDRNSDNEATIPERK